MDELVSRPSFDPGDLQETAEAAGPDFKGQTTQPDWSALLGGSTLAEMATAAASLLDAALARVLTASSQDLQYTNI